MLLLEEFQRTVCIFPLHSPPMNNFCMISVFLLITQSSVLFYVGYCFWILLSICLMMMFTQFYFAKVKYAKSILEYKGKLTFCAFEMCAFVWFFVFLWETHSLPSRRASYNSYKFFVSFSIAFLKHCMNMLQFPFSSKASWPILLMILKYLQHKIMNNVYF